MRAVSVDSAAGRAARRTGGAVFAEALSRLLMMRQQLSTQTSLSRGALYWLIFCSSFCASSQACSFLRASPSAQVKQMRVQRAAPVMHWNFQMLWPYELQRLEPQAEQLRWCQRVSRGSRSVQP